MRAASRENGLLFYVEKSSTQIMLFSFAPRAPGPLFNQIPTLVSILTTLHTSSLWVDSLVRRYTMDS